MQNSLKVMFIFRIIVELRKSHIKSIPYINYKMVFLSYPYFIEVACGLFLGDEWLCMWRASVNVYWIIDASYLPHSLL